MSNIDDLIKLERIIKAMHYPTLQDLMKKTEKSKNTVLSNIRTINEYYESKYPEFENKKMILNSKESGKQGYYYEDPSYTLSIEELIDPEIKLEQDKKRDELIRFLKNNVTKPGLLHPRISKDIKESIKNTEDRLDRCKTLANVLFFYDDALISTRGKNYVAEELKKNHLKCFESDEIKKIVNSYRKYL